MEAELGKLLADGVGADEVRRAKRRLLAGAIYARDSLRRGAVVIGTALTTGRTIADVEDWPERVRAVTLAEVNEAARAVFDLSKSVTGILLPAPKSQARAP